MTDKSLKQRIEEMVKTISGKKYKPEDTHRDYDKLLEDFILNYDPLLFPDMQELISLEKDFWYA